MIPTEFFRLVVVVILTFFLAFSNVSPPLASAVPQCFTNGHAYEVVNVSLSWDAANANATKSTFESCAGYLVVVTSAVEDVFVYSLANATVARNMRNVWMGAELVGTDTTLTGCLFQWAKNTAADESGKNVSIGRQSALVGGPFQCLGVFCNYRSSPNPSEPTGDPMSAIGYFGPLLGLPYTSYWEDQPRSFQYPFIVEYGNSTCFPCASKTPTPSLTATRTTTRTPARSISATPSLSITPASITATKTLSNSQQANPSSTPTRTPSHRDRLIVINRVCGLSLEIVCPNGKCVKDPTKCSGSLSGKDDKAIQIDELEVPVTKEFVGKDVRINALQSIKGSSKQLAVAIDFSRNTLKPGWRVLIRHPKSSTLDSSSFNRHRGDCGGKSEQQVASPPFEIDVYDEHGNKVKKFDPPLTLSSFATIDGKISDNNPGGNKHKRVCFGYNNGDPNEKWSCITNNQFDVLQTQTDDTKFVSSTSDHLTSFAVLLGSTMTGECDGWGWIEIASLTMIGSCCCFVLLLGGLYLRSKKFQAAVQGYDQSKRLTKIQTNIGKKETEIVAETTF